MDVGIAIAKMIFPLRFRKKEPETEKGMEGVKSALRRVEAGLFGGTFWFWAELGHFGQNSSGFKERRSEVEKSPTSLSCVHPKPRFVIRLTGPYGTSIALPESRQMRRALAAL